MANMFIDDYVLCFRDYLQDCPLSQDRIAMLCGFNQSTVSRWASGKVTPRKALMVYVLGQIEKRLLDYAMDCADSMQYIGAEE